VWRHTGTTGRRCELFCITGYNKRVTYLISNIANVLKITNLETATDFAIRPVCTVLKIVGILKEVVHRMDHSI